MTARGTVTVVVGAQFGSEAKGAVCAALAKRDYGNRGHASVRVGGSQAGHTAYDKIGRAWALRHIPVAAVVNPDARLLIARGSEIDPDVLLDEIIRLEDAGFEIKNRLFVDRSATVIQDHHKHREASEGLTARLGSTAKGVGAARADRIMRTAQIWGDVADGLGLRSWDVAALQTALIAAGQHIVIEGVQGYGLGLHTEHYPKSTSSDTDAATFLALAGVSPWQENCDPVRVVLVARTFPIRVAGNSGDMHAETDWETLGLTPELTTVTRKVRRVGHWDEDLVLDAIRANGGPAPTVELAISMLDQRYAETENVEFHDLKTDAPTAWRWLEYLQETYHTRIGMVGTGPDSWSVSDHSMLAGDYK